MNGSRRRIYVDHAATTPARAEVVEAMLPHLGELGFNPSSVYAEGRHAKAALDEARAGVARALGARPREIVFTGGGSEANTLAIAGAARALRERRRHVVTSTIEHHAVLHAVEMLRGDGFEVTLVARCPTSRGTSSRARSNTPRSCMRSRCCAGTVSKSRSCRSTKTAASTSASLRARCATTPRSSV